MMDGFREKERKGFKREKKREIERETEGEALKGGPSRDSGLHYVSVHSRGPF